MSDKPLFVYGTLMRDGDKEAVLNGDLRTCGNGFYPAITALGTGRRIYGRLRPVTDEDLQSFDFYEGHPHIYRRVSAKTMDGTRVWVYVWSYDDGRDCLEPGPLLEDGRWKGRVAIDPSWRTERRRLKQW